MAVNSGVHYGSGVANAFWDANATVMYYGDGDGITFKPLTALDVCGHETGHGITQYTCNLNYTYGQESSALNEGFSDIWGACVEHDAAPNKQMWLMGEEIFISTYNAIRNLQNPRASNLYEGPHPDTYHGDNWDPYGEPHFNSTVLSHWFYLLVTGGTGWNDGHTSHATAGNGYQWSVTGIGINDAQRIVYRTELLYLMPTADYAATRNAAIQAAIDIFGANSCQEKSVKDAWNAVGIGASYFGSPLSVSGDDLFCASTSNPYILTNLSVGVPMQWQATPSGVVDINSPTSSQTTLTKRGNGIITLTAIIPNPCTGNPITITKENIIVGSPQPGPITPTLVDYHLGKIQVEVDPVPGATDYRWYKDGVWAIPWSNYHGTFAQIPITRNRCDVGYTIEVQAINSCGASAKTSTLVFVPCDDGFRVSPNPASSSITVSVNPDNASVTYSYFDEVKVYDQQGNLKIRQKFNKVNSGSFSVGNLVNGTYIVEIISGNYTERQSLIIQR